MQRSNFSVQDHDPDRFRSLPQLYAGVIAQARHAEALGCDTFRVAEHYFHAVRPVRRHSPLRTAADL
uniref:LLM class flavin-dependent oxidoreductase n=1 Tax=Ralstonia solanacearum TaxID=305 RepID=A0A809EAI0_RALSL